MPSLIMRDVLYQCSFSQVPLYRMVLRTVIVLFGGVGFPMSNFGEARI